MARRLFLTAILTAILCISNSLFAQLSGSGAESDPYLIQSRADFEMFADSANADTYWASGVYTKLMCDIDFGGETITPIAVDTDLTELGFNGTPFGGVFVGNDKVLSNFKIVQPDREYVGLFGYTVSGALISNLGLEAFDITGRRNVGGLVGSNNGCAIDNCYTIGSVNGKEIVGGLVGHNYNGTISNSYAVREVLGSEMIVGGLVGHNDGFISNSYATGSVSGKATGSGGLVGHNTGLISNCYASGDFSGSSHTGGLVGYNQGSISTSYSIGTVSGGGWYVGGLVGGNEGSISLSYAVGTITGNYFIGGLIGINSDGTMADCFWDTQVSCVAIGVGDGSAEGGIGKTTGEMQMQATFADAGWDFIDTWSISEGSNYPRFQWQGIFGGGTENSPYLIESRGDFDKFADLANAQKYWTEGVHTKLMCDIDFGGDTITPIAPDTNPEKSFHGGVSFAGVFDGNNKVLSNFKINLPESNYVGLFCDTESGAVISDLELESIEITGKTNVGALVGNNEGTIRASYAIGSVRGDWYVGGLVGNHQGTISTSYVIGTVSGEGWYVGGLVGNNEGTVRTSYATGTVSGEKWYVGGLVGANRGTISTSWASGNVTGNGERIGGFVGGNLRSKISNCYATGTVSGNQFIGGLVGYNYEGIIRYSYSTVEVAGNKNVGGLVGLNDFFISSIINSFWDIQASGTTIGSGYGSAEGILGRNTDRLKTQVIFVYYGWDFVDTWAICEGTNYPRLQWQILSGDFVCPDGVNLLDFAYLAERWMNDDCELNQNCESADLNEDGTVNIPDLIIFANQWLK